MMNFTRQTHFVGANYQHWREEWIIVIVYLLVAAWLLSRD